MAGFLNRTSRRFGRGSLAAVAASVLTAGMLSGCSDWSWGSWKKSGTEDLPPRGVAFLEEVPVPKGFSLVEGRSIDHQSSGQRMALHEYKGSADPLAVRDFYRQQMPRSGWELVSDDSVKGMTTMRFEKKREVCIVKIRSATFGRCVINVEVSPFSRTSLEPPKQR